MSRLKELRLQGFKTFAEPTRFVFEQGVNAVIGPNGSGKSNMADAVRWVLGEQSNRSLRTRRAEDVIFAGSDRRKPTGLAEVTMTLDNHDGWLPIDFGEVTIGRRAYRSGEAEYLLNGARVRLRDVSDLLAGGQLAASSLVIVGQGTVDAALSLRPDERRQLFEEAAGVKNLQVRKNESLGRLSRAEENLMRVSDLLGELRPQVRRLALQAEHQQEHDALGRRARALVAEAHRRRERDLREALGEARHRAAAAEAAAEGLRAELAAGRQAVARAEARYWEGERLAREAATRRESTREAVIRLESRAEALLARGSELEQQLASAEGELRALAGSPQADGQRAEPRELRAVLDAAAAAEKTWQGAVAALVAADAELVAAEEALAAAREDDAELLAAQARHRDALSAQVAKLARFAQELAGVREEVVPAREQAASLRDEATRRTARSEDAARSLASAREASEEAHRLADGARRRATATAERVAAAQAELDALTERADRSGAIRERLLASGWRSLIDAMRAPDAAWPAIEAVVGGEVSDALLWRDADPGSAMADARGTARLLDGRDAPDREERGRGLAAVGARRTLADWIGADEVPGIFERVAVAPDLPTLLAGWRGLPAGWCAVTAEGDLADARGLVALRGRADPPGGAEARQVARRRQLGEELAILEPEYAGAADAGAAAVAAAAAAERRRVEAQRAAEAAEAEARQSEAEADLAERGVERLRAEETRLALAESEAQAEGQALESATTKGDSTRTGDRSSLEERAAKARRVREEAAGARHDAREAWVAARQRADESERQEVGASSRMGNLAARRDQLARSVAEARAALATVADDRARLEAELADAHAADDVGTRARTDADAQRERLRTELLRLEREDSGAGARLTELDRSHESAAVEVTRHEEALAALAREREIALEAFLPEPVPEPAPEARAEREDALEPAAGSGDLAREIGGLDQEALETDLRRIRRLLAQIGSVNPFAVEEHREHASRLQELSAQDDDLRAAIAATRELIARLDAEIEERFTAAFGAIGAAFDEFARLLFAGGSASLETTDGDDPDTAGGIEIVVRPPGKRPQRLAMLSGGERALTGVALLFAMLSVNPVPFCILDEVDAALDEANIGRFAQALRRLAETIDFVVITHNRATIEVADTIYGVTMTDAAVSSVVSLRLADLPVEASA